MKVRFHGDSIRLRLSRAEVAALGAGKPAIGETRISLFLRFMVKVAPADVPAITLTLEGLAIAIAVPRTILNAWAANEEEGLYATQDNGDQGLTIAIEKDFTCLHTGDTRQNEDTFPHPAEGR